MFARTDKDFPEVIPLNFTEASVRACMQMMIYVRSAGIRTGHNTKVVDDIVQKIDPVCADGKMRKDRSIDFVLDQVQYLFLAKNTEFFADHKIHHNPNSRINCNEITSLLYDVTFAGAIATMEIAVGS